MSGINTGYSPVATWLPDEKLHRRLIAELVNRLLGGKMNCTLEVTLTHSATTTTITDSRIGGSSHFSFCPLTANAVTSLGSLYVSARAKGSAILTHASSANTDQTFSIGIFG